MRLILYFLRSPGLWRLAVRTLVVLFVVTLCAPIASAQTALLNGTGTGQTVDWFIAVPPRQGAPPILRWRSSLAGRTHAHHQWASQEEACRMQNHVVGFRWCCNPPRLACPFRRPPLDSAGLACGPAGLPPYARTPYASSPLLTTRE